ncbi:hypothetical protein [Kitasatospora sp. NPDC056731]|uniref:hypothetical protein n=1 Tax=Kitasatospora sp. NPDC056731 TaxID=3155422 RepID=UPI0034170A31
MPTIYLVSAAPGDRVPGHELADPDCPSAHFPGLLERQDVTAWLNAIPYNDDSPDELVYLVTEDDPGTIPAGFDTLMLEI